MARRLEGSARGALVAVVVPAESIPNAISVVTVVQMAGEVTLALTLTLILTLALTLTLTLTPTLTPTLTLPPTRAPSPALALTLTRHAEDLSAGRLRVAVPDGLEVGEELLALLPDGRRQLIRLPAGEGSKGLGRHLVFFTDMPKMIWQPAVASQPAQ